jgi:hypothetical protein
MRAWLWSLACVSLLATGVSCTDEPLGPGQYRWEGRRGFAIWPEDQPADALAACERSAHAQSWRTDPAATAEEFVRSVLRWRRPPDLSDHRVPEGAPRTAFSMIDGSMPDSALGVVVHLRQLRGCWFVAAVWPREGDIAGRYRWAKLGEGYALRAVWKGETPINLEVGWGGDVEERRLRRGESVTIPVPDSGASGHILWFYDRPSELTLGEPVSPPRAGLD